MNFDVLLYIAGYILAGVFIASAVHHVDGGSDDFDEFMLDMLFWPLLLAALTVGLIFAIPYILGKWAGHLLHDLVKVIK